MDRENRLKRLRYRAWHRGTKEADLLIGGFFDRYAAGWSAVEIDWYEALLEEQDVADGDGEAAAHERAQRTEPGGRTAEPDHARAPGAPPRTEWVAGVAGFAVLPTP